MVPEMQFQKASEEHLRTWQRICKLFTVSVIGLTILLAVMASTLL